MTQAKINRDKLSLIKPAPEDHPVYDGGFRALGKCPLLADSGRSLRVTSDG
jgi:hypothetical protein